MMRRQLYPEDPSADVNKTTWAAAGKTADRHGATDPASCIPRSLPWLSNRRPGATCGCRWAAVCSDPEAALGFIVSFMGASPILQRRGPVADGTCALLKWATWPLDGGHEWHLVDAMQVGSQPRTNGSTTATRCHRAMPDAHQPSILSCLWPAGWR